MKKKYETGELDKNTTISKMETVVNRGFRGEVPEEVDFYNLDAIIAVGSYFCQWVSQINGHDTITVQHEFSMS